MDEIPRTPDDAMIKSWIASLELKAKAAQADMDYNAATGGQYITDEDFDNHDSYLLLIELAKRALKKLLEG